jgi:exopolyphosphatase / guanosine-5'-triphosphate,3'-diphosphate pyrophosphatase
MKIAIVDLGTNTCNLLIAEADKSDFKILHQSKEHVRLGDDKIKTDEISGEATQRAIQSFLTHKKIIQSFQAEKVRSIATSAVRTAENKIKFLDEIGEKTGYVVKVVSGEKEAELIFKGVLLAVSEFAEPAVILDIGGGSNEIILASGKELLWKESRPTGMSRIIHRFEISDPVLPEEIVMLQNFFTEEHQSAIEKCKAEKIKTLIGCSGAFDTMADIIDNVNPGEKQRITQEISVDDFYRVYEQLVKSTRHERLAMKGMDLVRIDLIVPAVILIRQLIKETGIQKILQTDFALREGVLYEFMNKG